MAIEKWTVFYGQRDAGNQKPVTGWKEKEMIVLKNASTTKLEKNKPWNVEQPGTFASAEIGECKFVTVQAESAEEAILVVDKFLAQGFLSAALAEEFTKGPQIKGNQTNACNKGLAALTSNITEVTLN